MGALHANCGKTRLSNRKPRTHSDCEITVAQSSKTTNDKSSDGQQDESDDGQQDHNHSEGRGQDGSTIAIVTVITKLFSRYAALESLN
ncbi:hypothetical protein V6N13_144869 [Hibiscus sabdariffa]